MLSPYCKSLVSVKESVLFYILHKILGIIFYAYKVLLKIGVVIFFGDL